MVPWSTKRKAIYVAGALAVLVVVVLVPLFFFLYQKPTCFDGAQNGDETGRDCGGSCQILCSFEAIDPIVVWSRAFKVNEGLYSATAYIENPNINSEAVTRYEFKLFDQSNKLVATRANTAFLPKNKVFAIFEPNINVGTSTPRRVTFEFTEQPAWYRNLAPSPNIVVTRKVLSGHETRPRLDATIENMSSVPLSRIEVAAIVYDDRENAIATSRTFVDRLEVGVAADVVFTWPTPFETSEEICRVPRRAPTPAASSASVPASLAIATSSSAHGPSIGSRPEALGVVLAIDRSGSMESDGKNPPEPLTSVKNAAASFVDRLQGTDTVGVVSFATTASDPPDAALSSEYEAVKNIVKNISIKRDGTTQYTNIGDAIEKSARTFLAPDMSDVTERVIVLLTDGIATQPEKAGNPNYPLEFAEAAANKAKIDGIQLYIIGLGREVNAGFLQKLASTPEDYFPVFEVEDVAEVYEEVAIKICKRQPAVIEIIPRVIPVVAE